MDLLERGFGVEIVVDAVSSRTAQNKHLALRKAERSGAGLTSVEMVLFEQLRVAEGEQFKQILQIVK